MMIDNYTSAREDSF